MKYFLPNQIELKGEWLTSTNPMVQELLSIVIEQMMPIRLDNKIFRKIWFSDGTSKEINKVGVSIQVKGEKIIVK